MTGGWSDISAKEEEKKKKGGGEGEGKDERRGFGGM